MQKFDNYIKGEKKLLIIASHPLDCDSIGTGLILKKYLESLNKKVRLVFPGKPQNQLREIFEFLPYFNEIEFRNTKEFFKTKLFDVVIFVDGSNLAQFYENKKNDNPPNILLYDKRIHIDHHALQQEKLGVVHIHDPRAAATAEILIKKIIPCSFIDDKIATLAYAAIIEDTGNFKWNFTPTTFEIASLLIKKGAKFQEIIDKIYASKSKNYLKMLSFALDNCKYDSKLKTIFLFVPHLIFKKEKFDNFALRELRTVFRLELAGKVKNFDRGILIYEQEKGVIEIKATGNNLRNKINLPQLLTKMGGNGGGHINACGTIIYGRFNQVKKRLLKLLREYQK